MWFTDVQLLRAYRWRFILVAFPVVLFWILTWGYVIAHWLNATQTLQMILCIIVLSLLITEMYSWAPLACRLHFENPSVSLLSNERMQLTVKSCNKNSKLKNNIVILTTTTTTNHLAVFIPKNGLITRCCFFLCNLLVWAKDAFPKEHLALITSQHHFLRIKWPRPGAKSPKCARVYCKWCYVLITHHPYYVMSEVSNNIANVKLFYASGRNIFAWKRVKAGVKGCGTVWQWQKGSVWHAGEFSHTPLWQTAVEHVL